MQLYFSPLACSMATRITFYEAGAEAGFVEVDSKTKKTSNGEDYLAVNPLGLVPALRLTDGDVLTENAAILQYVAEQFPDAALAPKGGLARARLQQWLCFVGTELHKATFIPLLDPKTQDETRTKALENGKKRLDYLNRHLTDRDYLLDAFSVADAYLFTVLNWTLAVPSIMLAQWPALHAYMTRMRERPSVAKAFAEEMALYQAEKARQKAA